MIKKRVFYKTGYKKLAVILVILSFFWISFSSYNHKYTEFYDASIKSLIDDQYKLIQTLRQGDFRDPDFKEKIIADIHQCRIRLKKADFWIRYLEPTVYKKINGPLPVEWETEVFEKFEKPYRREGAGLTLAEQYLEEDFISKDVLINLLSESASSSKVYLQDSITRFLTSHHHFFLANRLFLLNLAAIYTSGFECPNSDRVIPELRTMISYVLEIYKKYNQEFQKHPLDKDYLDLFNSMLFFVNNQSEYPALFNHYKFIKDYVNILFSKNQKFIREYKIQTENYNDFSLNNKASSIFDKNLFTGQDIKGVYRSITDEFILDEIKSLGRLLFYDPLLSGNNLRSCASCHKPTEFFADTTVSTALQFDKINRLTRNTPSLINSEFNHLLMMDGKHYNFPHQMSDVITNPIELNSQEDMLLKKILSCSDYKKSLKKFSKLSTNKKLGIEHITSALSIYFNSFNYYYSPFDNAMNNNAELEPLAIEGFNIFMNRAQCATCHFVPHFNGVKPPYIGSEFEVIGVPADSVASALSPDKGRFLINPSEETLNAFRTGTLRNISQTKPYMHNGVFHTLEQLIDFYDVGGGKGKGLNVENQTLSPDSLKLNPEEKKALIIFMNSLSEYIPFEPPPLSLPMSSKKELNFRKVGGVY